MKFLLLFLLTGCACEQLPSSQPVMAGMKEFANYDEVCVKGVVYYRTSVHGGSVLTAAWYQSPTTTTHYLRTCP